MKYAKENEIPHVLIRSENKKMPSFICFEILFYGGRKRPLGGEKLPMGLRIYRC